MRYTVEVVESGHVLTPVPVGLAAAVVLADRMKETCGAATIRVVRAGESAVARPVASRAELARVAHRRRGRARSARGRAE